MLKQGSVSDSLEDLVAKKVDIEYSLKINDKEILILFEKK